MTAAAAPPRSGPLGDPVVRLEGRAKVTGAARYAAEYTPDDCAYAWPVPATVAKGAVTAVHTGRALAEPGALAVLTHENAPRLGDAGDATLAVLQSPRVAHRGQYVALAVADTLAAARAAAAAVRVEYAAEPHDVVLETDHPRLADVADAGRERGDFDAGYAAAQVRIDAVYTVPALHNHPMEPHATTAWWESGALTVYDSNQGSTPVRQALAALFRIPPDRVTVHAEHVGGGFGAKGTPRPQVVLAAMAAQEVNRPVKLALPRNQLAAVTGYRAATVQRIRLGADTEGHLAAFGHDVETYRSTVSDWVERAVQAGRSLYAAPHRRMRLRAVPLDVPSPSWMRAPGECSGMFAVESAMDELAVALALDPVELRIRNDTGTDPDSGHPFGSRHLAQCLREGARRFDWADRDPAPAMRREGRYLLGTGVAACSYPAEVGPSQALAHADPAGGYLVQVDATDIGTGARTVLAQIAARALRVGVDEVEVGIGCSALPPAPVAGGSAGTASWGWAVDKACRALRRRLDELDGMVPGEGLTVRADTAEDVADHGARYAHRSFGAQFAEVRVDTDTGETRVRRLLGVFAAGRILNPRTAASQLSGGMVMGLGMALTEDSTMDEGFGDHAERDLASYHVPSCADVPDIDVHWLPEEDPHLNPMGAKGIGELGVVGTAAAVANAVHHATGVRVRDLPVHPDLLLEGMIAQGRL
ncbi:xanthine dehydrogenase family protein molybdopterin-binding subunit [Streptomyces capparidis]